MAALLTDRDQNFPALGAYHLKGLNILLMFVRLIGTTFTPYGVHQYGVQLHEYYYGRSSRSSVVAPVQSDTLSTTSTSNKVLAGCQHAVAILTIAKQTPMAEICRQ